MEFLTWEVAGQALTAASAIGGIVGAVRVKKSAGKWKALVQAVQQARADKVWTNEEIVDVLTKAAAALATLVPFGRKIFKLK